MRARPVDNPHFLEYQATILLCLAAGGLTVLLFQEHDLEFLTMHYEAWPQEPWRLLTSCLLHANFLHLAFNLYWTLRFGATLEPIFGSLPMVGIFVLLGAGSSATQWAFSAGGIGLSGIGFGLFALTWALDRYSADYRGILDERTTTLFVLWFFFCIAATIADILPIANWAHGAGAVLGGLLGLSLSPQVRRRVPARLGLAFAIPLIVLISTAGRPYLNFSQQYAWELSREGYLALMRGDDARAVELLERSTRRSPDSHIAWNNLGIAYDRLGRPMEAQRAFRRAAEAAAGP